MPETPAASSPATEVDVFNGMQPTLAEFIEYRKTGEVAPRFKPEEPEPAESAPADQPEQTEPEKSESESEEAQEQPQKGKRRLTAEERVAQLRAIVEQEWEKDNPDHDRITRTEATIDKIQAGQKRKTEPAPAAQPQSQAAPQLPATYTEWEEKFIESEASSWMEKWAQAHPDKPYESGTAAMAAYMRSVERQYEAASAQMRAVQARIDEAKARYEDFDQVIAPALKAIHGNVPPVIEQMLRDSEYTSDVLYVLGDDADELARFVAMAQKEPGKAIRHLAKLELGIAEELSKPETPERGEDGKFKAPEKRQTAAPKPPSPVNSGGKGRAFDVSDVSLSPEEWARQRNADIARRKKA